MTYKYFEGEGFSAISKDSDSLKIIASDGVDIDYSLFKEVKGDPSKIKDNYNIVEKTVKGKVVKTVEAKDVQQDSKQPKEDNPI